MARHRWRGGSLFWPGAAVVIVLALSMSGALGSLRYAVPLMLKAGEDAPFHAVQSSVVTDPGELRTRLLALLAESDEGLTTSLDGCFLIREGAAADACDTQEQSLILREQVDLRDLIVNPAYVRVAEPATTAGEVADGAITLSFPWRPRIRAGIRDAALSLQEIAPDTAARSATPDPNALSERLLDGAYGDLLGRNHRIRAACGQPPRVSAITEDYRITLPAEQAEDVISVMMGLESSLCHGRSWLF